MNRLPLLFVLGALSCLAAGVAGAADTRTMSDLSVSQMFDIAGKAAEAGQVAEAETLYRALAHDPDSDVRNEARFRLAQLLEQQKRDRDAAISLRAILDEKPDAARVRLELAQLLARMGEERGAMKELRQAQATGLPPDIARFVKQITLAYRSQKPFGLSLEVALAPDSNINRATRVETLDTVIAPLQLSKDARERSGLGMRVSAQAYARIPLSSSAKLLTRVTQQTSLYRDGQFDDLTVSARTGIEWSAKALLVTPTIGRAWRWFGGPLYNVTDSGGLNLRRSLGKRAVGEIDATAGFASYSQNALQSGPIYDLAFSYERALTTLSGASVTLSAERQVARDPGYATAFGGISLTYWHDAGRMTLYGSATVRRLEADRRLALFFDRRRETYWRLGAGATFRQAQVAGFAPVLRISYERNASTIALYDYRRGAMEVGITRAF